MVSPLILQVIKSYINSGQYSFIFECSNGGQKTYNYMIEKGFTRAILAQAVLNLRERDHISTTRDTEPRYDNGDIFIFKSNCFGDYLYIKVKIPDSSGKMLIMSIHPEGMYS